MEATTDNGKTVAIISYFFFIGWIIALIINNGNKTTLGSFHIRQSLGIMCVGVLLIIIFDFIDIWVFSAIVVISIIAFWLIGLISAVQGEMKPVPVLGEQFQEWFKGI